MRDDRAKKILKAFKDAEKLGRKEISADTIALRTGLSPQLVNNKLDNLSKFGFVRKKQKKPVFYWEMV